MQVFQSKTGLINVVISLLIVVMVVFMLIPSVPYEVGTEDEGEVSVYGYVLLPTEKPYKNVTKWLEKDYYADAAEGEEYEINKVYADPMLLLVFGIVAILICFAGYKNWVSSVFPIVWGYFGIHAATANMFVSLSNFKTVYLALAIAAIALALVNFCLNTFLKKKVA